MISSKMAKLISYMPKGLVNYISKKLVDKYIDKYADIYVTGEENLRNIKKPVIFICNHLSNSDGLILNRILKEQDVTFVAGVKLSNDPVTNIGINIVKTITIKPNSADKEAITKVVSTIKEGNNVVIFPEGTRSRVGSMIEAKKGILLIARLTKASIIPIGMWGTEKLLPINKNGNMSGEKFNHAKVTVTIGKPVSLPEKLKDEDRHAYDDRSLNVLMKHISVLLPEEYRGVYK